MSIENILGLLAIMVSFFAAVQTYRVGHERNRTDAARLDLDKLSARQDAVEKAAEERHKAREAEREQDRLDREAEKKARADERKADIERLEFQRQMLLQQDQDIRELRTENTKQAEQIFGLISEKDKLRYDFDASERDRAAKVSELAESKRVQATLSDTLHNANTKIALLEGELAHTRSMHEVEIASLNALNTQTRAEITRILDEHHAQLTQIQLGELPRQMEITRLRFALRQANTVMQAEQIASVTDALKARDIDYEALLFPRPDPLAFVPPDADLKKAI